MELDRGVDKALYADAETGVTVTPIFVATGT